MLQCCDLQRSIKHGMPSCLNVVQLPPPATIHMSPASQQPPIVRRLQLRPFLPLLCTISLPWHPLKVVYCFDRSNTCSLMTFLPAQINLSPHLATACAKFDPVKHNMLCLLTARSATLLQSATPQALESCCSRGRFLWLRKCCSCSSLLLVPLGCLAVACCPAKRASCRSRCLCSELGE